MLKTDYGQINERLKVLSVYIKEDEHTFMDYLIYHLEVMDNENKKQTFYKAVKVFRLTRVSKEARENKKFMENHTDIIRAMYKAKINFCEIVCNILKPEPYGLMLLYGVQARGESEDEAIKKCKIDFNAFIRSFQGTNRTAHITGITKREMEWILGKLKTQKYTSCIKGLPLAKKTSGDTHRQGGEGEVNTEEQFEQLLIGADSIEYCIVMMATPINEQYLYHWLEKSLKEQTRWERQKQGQTSIGFSIGIPLTLSQGVSSGTSVNRGSGTNESRGINQSHGVSENQGWNKSQGGNEGTSYNHGTNTGWNKGTNDSFGTNEGRSVNDGTNVGYGRGANVSGGVFFVNGGYNQNHNWGSNHSVGTNTGTSENHGTSEGVSGGENESYGTNEGKNWSEGLNGSKGTNDSFGSNESKGTNKNFSQGSNVGTNQGFSTGLNMGFNFSKSSQWIDCEVQYITELLGRENQRLKQMADGDGGFYCDMYVCVGSEEDQKAMEGLAITTWVNPDGKIDVLRMEIPSQSEQRKLSNFAYALSPCLEICVNPSNNKGYFYKFSSVLTSTEVATYCHPPRVNVGGLNNSLEDLPKFNVPTTNQNKEIFLGYVMNPERYNYDMAIEYGEGYLTPYKFCISNKELHHMFIAGASRSGKSVLAFRMALETYNKTYSVRRNTITGEDEIVRKRFLVLDPKGEWRQLAPLIPKGKFQFYSVGKPHFHPLKMNILRVPRYIDANQYVDMVIAYFCASCGLLDRAVTELKSIVLDLYAEAKVFEEGHEKDVNWAYERTANITLAEVYEVIKKKYEEAQQSRSSHLVEVYQTYMTRLVAYGNPYRREYIMFCNKGGDSCDSVLGEDTFSVIEANGLSAETQKFFFMTFMDAVYQNAINRGPKGFYTNSYETIIVLEEANSMLPKVAGGEDTSGQVALQKFNNILDKSASLGLFIWTITQTIASVPKDIIANSGIACFGRLAQEEDIKVALSSLGYDSGLKDIEYKRFFSRLPVGRMIVKASKSQAFEDLIPTLIKVAMLDSIMPSDEELEVFLQDHELARQGILSKE